MRRVFLLDVVPINRGSWIWSAITIFVAALLMSLATAYAGIAVPMPSFPPLKTSIFLAGMLIAGARGLNAKAGLLLILAILFMAIWARG